MALQAGLKGRKSTNEQKTCLYSYMRLHTSENEFNNSTTPFLNASILWHL